MSDVCETFDGKAFDFDFDALAEKVKVAFGRNVPQSLPTDADEYALHGVDNEFDFLEAVYAEWSECSPHLLDAPFFVRRRIVCAMDPRYTKRCLESPAFFDVKGEILRRLRRR